MLYCSELYCTVLYGTVVYKTEEPWRVSRQGQVRPGQAFQTSVVVLLLRRLRIWRMYDESEPEHEFGGRKKRVALTLVRVSKMPWNQGPRRRGRGTAHQRKLTVGRYGKDSY